MISRYLFLKIESLFRLDSRIDALDNFIYLFMSAIRKPSLKCNSSYRYKPILFILHRDHSYGVLLLAFSLLGGFVIVSQFCDFLLFCYTNGLV